jgi:Mg/Co/Ni transporter MgtE
MTQLIWHNEKRRIKDLIPYELNPRVLSEEQAKQLKKSLEKFNLVEIPVIGTDNKILVGDL